MESWPSPPLHPNFLADKCQVNVRRELEKKKKVKNKFTSLRRSGNNIDYSVIQKSVRKKQDGERAGREKKLSREQWTDGSWFVEELTVFHHQR